MRAVTCDHCGFSAPAPGLSRLDNWSSVRMTIRELRENGRARTTDPEQSELCPDCTAEMTAFLSKAQT